MGGQQGTKVPWELLNDVTGQIHHWTEDRPVNLTTPPPIPANWNTDQTLNNLSAGHPTGADRLSGKLVLGGLDLPSQPGWFLWRLQVHLLLLWFVTVQQRCRIDCLYTFLEEAMMPDILISWCGSFPQSTIWLSFSMNEAAATGIPGMSSLSARSLLWFSQHGESIDPLMTAVDSNLKMATDGAGVEGLPVFITGWLGEAAGPSGDVGLLVGLVSVGWAVQVLGGQ